MANEQLVQENVFTVESLRPNGVYEFRVRGKNQDGLGHPSMSSGGVAIRPAAPQRHVPARKVSNFIFREGIYCEIIQNSLKSVRKIFETEKNSFEHKILKTLIRSSNKQFF